MAEEPSAQNAETTDPQSSGNFVDKAKEFFTMGGDKKKWTKALIISALVLIFMGLAATAAGGVALSFLVKSIAEPNNCTTSSSSMPTTDKITIDGKEYTIPGNGQGGISAEDHLVTKEDTTKAPTSTSDGIEGHLSVTNFSTNCASGSYCTAGSQRWTPAEGGGQIGQGTAARGTIPSADEPWVMNARWDPMPKPGTRVIITSKQNGNSVVAVAGYEYGPSASTGNIAGAQKEVLAKLGVSHGNAISFGFATDQTLVPGTLYSPTSTTNLCSSGNNFGPGVIYRPNAYNATQIDNYLKSKSPSSPLNGKGVAFIAAGQKYGVNPGFLLGITNSESSLGIQCTQSRNLLNGTNNAFGLTCGGQTTFCHYSSYEDGINAAAKNVASPLYKRLDGSLKEFGLKWCGYETERDHPPVKLSDGSKITYDCKNNNSNWAKEVQDVMDAIR